jgi:hypothetical protein
MVDCVLHHREPIPDMVLNINVHHHGCHEPCHHHVDRDSSLNRKFTFIGIFAADVDPDAVNEYKLDQMHD